MSARRGRRRPFHRRRGIPEVGTRPIAAALAIHHDVLTEVPIASSLRKYRDMAANSLMYWRLIQRAIERGQEVFDFGRSTVGGGTYTFKKKWGAKRKSVMFFVQPPDVRDTAFLTYDYTDRRIIVMGEGTITT